MIGRRARRQSVVALFGLWLLTYPQVAAEGRPSGGAEPPALSRSSWKTLTVQADALGLPSRFLHQVPPDFVQLEFEDLHVYAAEYHPEEHRMVLNRSLSFNAAAGVLRPLAQMTHQEIATLYHELFHAYMDYLQSRPVSAAIASEDARLLVFAHDEQRCRYQQVLITPVVQRKSATELRYLSEGEAWEALNETWAVFVGWAIWTMLELSEEKTTTGSSHASGNSSWLERLQRADQEGTLVGYYEPEDPAERMMTHKRYLAPSHKISPREVALLLEVLFGKTAESAGRSMAVMQTSERPLDGDTTCRR
ncbi:MAG: hypothetical protein ACE5NA_10610 [Nitrospiraceae bacterium]